MTAEALEPVDTAAPILPLRPYQTECIDAVDVSWGRVRRPAVILPTGSGKTVIFSHMASASARRSRRFLIVAHREKLVKQAAAKLRAVAPNMDVGIDMADSYAHPWHQTVVATVQTLSSEHRRLRWAPDAFDVVVIDECHHATSQSYRDLLEYLGCFADGAGSDGGTRALGFTATLARRDGGLGSVWQEVAYERSIGEMIDDGYLVRPRGLSVPLDSLDLSKATQSNGDYTDSSLGACLEQAGFAPKIATAYKEHAADRRGIVFTPTVRTAQMAAVALNDAGIPSAAVWGEMSKDEKDRVESQVSDGSVQVACNCMMWTEGFDEPALSCCVVARPCKPLPKVNSSPLYVQMIGRVLRPDPESEKTDALVLDVTQSSYSNKIVTLKDLSLDRPKSKVVAQEELDGDESVPGQQRRKMVYGKTEEVDLFGRSSSVWLRTDQGHWFVPAGGGFVFLDPYWPGNGTITIGWMPPRAGTRPEILGDAPELPLAMAIGEQHAIRADRESGRKFTTSARGAAWRQGSEPSPRQMEVAGRLGLTVSTQMSPGQVSDMISAKIASRRLDGFFKRQGLRR